MPPKTFTTTQLQARTLKRGQKVKLVTDLPGVSAGAEGKVAMANGFAWYRYWVRFADGKVVGHIDHHDLVRAKDFERFLVARQREAEQAEKAALATGPSTDEPAADTGAAAAGAGSSEAVVNGVTVPAYLLKRSADARTRLSA